MPKKRIAKRGAKGWKQFNMGDIQAGIAEQNLQDLRNQNLKSSANDELFTIDKRSRESLSEKRKRNREQLASNIPERTLTDLVKPLKKSTPKKEKKLVVPKTLEEKKVTKDAKIEGVYDLWGDDDQTQVQKPKKTISKLSSLKLPHAGQSYNPDEQERQLALKVVHEKEMKIHKKTDQFVSMMFKKETNSKKKSKETSNEPLKESEETTEKKKKRKSIKELSVVKRAGVTKSKQELARHKEKKRKREEQPIDAILEDLNTIKDHQKHKLRIKKKKLEKQKQPQFPLNDVNDVLLENEIPTGLRALPGNSRALWIDGLKKLKNSDLFEEKDINRIINVYHKPGIPIKEK